MVDSNNEYMSAQEAFEQAYYYFFQALELLASDPDTQCKRGGNYNVAWELKDDISAGTYIFNLPERLSVEQKREIIALIAAVDAIPSEVLRSTTNPTENLRAMNDPCWVPLRVRAINLIKLLEPATKKNQEFYAGGSSDISVGE